MALSPKQQQTLPMFAGGMPVEDARNVDKRTLRALMDRDLVIFDEGTQKYFLAEEAPAQAGSLRMLIEDGRRRLRLIVLDEKRGMIEVLNVWVEARSTHRLKDLRQPEETLKAFNFLGYQLLKPLTKRKRHDASSHRRKS